MGNVGGTGGGHQVGEVGLLGGQWRGGEAELGMRNGEEVRKTPILRCAHGTVGSENSGLESQVLGKAALWSCGRRKRGF